MQLLPFLMWSQWRSLPPSSALNVHDHVTVEGCSIAAAAFVVAKFPHLSFKGICTVLIRQVKAVEAISETSFGSPALRGDNLCKHATDNALCKTVILLKSFSIG